MLSFYKHFYCLFRIQPLCTCNLYMCKSAKLAWLVCNIWRDPFGDVHFIKTEVLKWFCGWVITWRLCRAVWTSRCNCKGWRGWARVERSQSWWRFHPQPTKQCMISHLNKACLNTLQRRQWREEKMKESIRTDSFFCFNYEHRKGCITFFQTDKKFENVLFVRNSHIQSV